MTSHIRAQLILIVGTILICCIGYPAVLLLLGSGLFPHQASGSLVPGSKDEPVGSRLIAQEFKGDEWFRSRPSAVDYNAAGSGGSNLGANNPKLRERVVQQIQATGSTSEVPLDAVTASGSGLDPHITLANAKLQAARIAGIRKISVSQLEELIAQHSTSVLLSDETVVNVLELNQAMEQKYPLPTKR